MNRTYARGVTAIAAILTIAACGGGGDDELAVTGAFSLTDAENVVGDWDSCSGSGGYDDFGAGMDVTVRDGEGNIIGTGRTESLTVEDQGDFAGALDDEPSDTSTEANTGRDPDDPASMLEIEAGMAELFDGSRCTVKFEVPVKESEFYSIEVGSRGDQNYSHAELEEANWYISLSLG